MRTPPIKLFRPNEDSNNRADRPIEEPNERAPDRVDRPIEEPNERTRALDNVPPILKPTERVSSPVPPILNSTIKFNEDNSTIKFNEELSEQPSKRMKGIHCRRKSIGRRKDGLQKKTGSYDFAGVRRSHGLHSSAPPQQVI